MASLYFQSSDHVGHFEKTRCYLGIGFCLLITVVRISYNVTYHPGCTTGQGHTCGIESFSRMSTGVWCTDSPIAMMLLFCSIAYPGVSITIFSQTVVVLQTSGCALSMCRPKSQSARTASCIAQQQTSWKS